MDKTVSIIVPIYNVEKYLKKCVSSLIHQTYSQLEIILVNDGSPDNSPILCDEFAKEDKRVKVIHKENGGLSDARNAGLELASGDYTLFLDSDDYLELDAIEKLIHTIESTKSDVVIFGYYTDFLDNDEALYKTREVKGLSLALDETNFNQIPITPNVIGLLGYAWNKLYLTRIIKDNNMLFEKGISLVEDVLFNGPLFQKCTKIVFIEEMLIHYVQRDRVTLGAKLYDNHIDLKLMAITKIEELLIHWKINPLIVSKTSAQIMFNTLKAIIKLLSHSTRYDNKLKGEKLRELLKQPEVKQYLKQYKASTVKDKMLLGLMRKNQSKILLRLYR